MNNQDKILYFIEQAWDYVATYFYTETKGGDFFSVYPKFRNYEIHNNIAINNNISVNNYLGNLYQELASSKQKKDYGQFYTNNLDIINSMINRINILSGKILEPSCGAGTFLVEISKKIIEYLEKNNKTAEYIINYIIENLYGNDNDNIAIEICEINIISVLLPLIIKAYNENPKIRLNKLNLTNKDFILKDGDFHNFSTVIGNPPYITLYGKRSRNMTEEKRAYYNTFDFVQNKNGNNKFNVSMFFIENALKSLKYGGELIYILDISFLETAYIDIRKYLVEKYSIDLLVYGLSEFDNVASGQLILKVINKKIQNNSVELINYETNKRLFIEQANWNNSNNKYKYYIPLNDKQQRIIDKIKLFDTLEHYYPNKALRTCCALTGKTDEFIVDPTNSSKHLVFPYIEGSKGLKSKFAKPTVNRYIKYDYDLQIKLSDIFKEELSKIGVKNKKRVTLGDKNSYLSPKVFIRQSANEIIATYCESPYAANNSIYILTNKKNDDKNKKFLKYICGILNSDLITFYCRITNIIRTAKGKTPQIKTSDLKNVRICVSEKNFDNVVQLVDILLKNPKDKLSLKKLNNIVYSIYNIDENEVTYIDEYKSTIMSA